MIQGAIASLVTPFSAEGALDSKGLTESSHRLSSSGFDVLCFAGGTGEFLSLSQAEREAGLKAVIEGSNGKPVLASALYADPRETLKAAEAFARIGAAAIMIMPPYFYAPSQNAIRDFVANICLNSPLPVLLFNSAVRSGRVMSHDTIMSLASEHGSIVGIKETTDKVEDIERLVASVRDDFHVIQANEPLVLPSYSVGATGSFGSLCNIIPKTMIRLHRALATGDFPAARLETHEICRVAEIAYSITIPVGIKYVMRLLGTSTGIVRSPLSMSLTDVEEGSLSSLMRNIERLEADDRDYKFAPSVEAF